VKYVDFQQLTRSQSLPGRVTSRTDLERISLGLLAPLCPARKPVRLLGVSLSTLSSKGHEPGRATQICLEF
jgi:DNA polymerase-4